MISIRENRRRWAKVVDCSEKCAWYAHMVGKYVQVRKVWGLGDYHVTVPDERPIRTRDLTFRGVAGEHARAEASDKVNLEQLEYII